MFNLQYHKDLYLSDIFFGFAVLLSWADVFMHDVLKPQRFHCAFWVTFSSMDEAPPDYIKATPKRYITLTLIDLTAIQKVYFFPGKSMIEFSAVRNWKV